MTMCIYELVGNSSKILAFSTKVVFDSCFTYPTLEGHISLKNAAFFKWIFSSDPWDVVSSFGILHGKIHNQTVEKIATDYSFWNTPHIYEENWLFLKNSKILTNKHILFIADSDSPPPKPLVRHQICHICMKIRKFQLGLFFTPSNFCRLMWLLPMIERKKTKVWKWWR